jgi:hypothetical protein
MPMTDTKEIKVEWLQQPWLGTTTTKMEIEAARAFLRRGPVWFRGVQTRVM